MLEKRTKMVEIVLEKRTKMVEKALEKRTKQKKRIAVGQFCGKES
jgi:hypothetical protein